MAYQSDQARIVRAVQQHVALASSMMEDARRSSMVAAEMLNHAAKTTRDETTANRLRQKAMAMAERTQSREVLDQV
jgi:hypothetical protein